ncbi:hypothetical protein Asppvi_004547 [Aspergillus pseudoviridinutans]|uniref:WD40 repeat-like protein n=1 Tax=Aspergillus pseudoviridinutans TaxID=1517512 RepID=A0A9P3BDF2_9EURO|nr:uncharacterized protein Asppvi_004547 [Aspergillus pseudoviridinutans]GIJ85686.1 hypothetical protein Asppvi_004547 [Aspergillus pseudoviridinutans]
MEDNRSAGLQTLESHSGPVWSVVFSHDSRLVASASDDETVKIWDATSGQCLQTLTGHSWSPPPHITIKIWDATTANASRRSRATVICEGTKCVQTCETTTSILVSYKSYQLVYVEKSGCDQRAGLPANHQKRGPRYGSIVVGRCAVLEDNAGVVFADSWRCGSIPDADLYRDLLWARRGDQKLLYLPPGYGDLRAAWG